MTGNNFKIDLHTHSIISYDGGISKKQYSDLLSNGILDYIAITDHNNISFAKVLKQELGDRIIVGEEIKTTDGEIIGLYLNTLIPGGLSAKETVSEIKRDGGLVYIPHPFEKGRSSLQENVLNTLENVDIIEVFNGRGKFRGKPEGSYNFAQKNSIAMAASSDSHCKSGINTTFSCILEKPTSENLAKLLKDGEVVKQYAPWYSLLCPGYNKIKNKFVL